MKNEKTVTSFLKSNAIQLLSLIMLCLATYITVRLAPLSQDLAVMQQKVHAVEVQQEKLATKDQVDSLNRMVDGRLKSIEDKVNFMYQLYLK